MPITPITSPTQITPVEFPSIGETKGATQTGADFGSKIAESLENLQKTQATSNDLALKVATGELTDVHDYMIAAAQTEIATQLTVAVRNKAVDAFNQIMNMQV